MSGQHYLVAQYDSWIYIEVCGGVDHVTWRRGQLYHAISVEGYVDSMSVCDGLIYTLVYKSDSWSVRVYDSGYQLSAMIWSLIGNERLVVRNDSVHVPDRDDKTIIQYSLTGEVERRIPCHVLRLGTIWL
mgnify:CR=1 FL=1